MSASPSPSAGGDSKSNEQLPRSNKLCPSCGEAEAVFFQSQQRSAETGMVRDPSTEIFDE
ncbi:hypothetical protein APSETT445_008430 [Aspergillus pseudonomiae]